MLPAFTDIPTLADRLPGGIRDADVPRAQAALDFASTLIRGKTRRSWVDTNGDLALPTGTDEWKADALVSVCLEAAIRALENPEAFNDETGNDASSDVYLKRSELRLLNAVIGGSGIGSIDLEVGTPGWSGQVIAVAGQDEPMPFTYDPLRLS